MSGEKEQPGSTQPAIGRDEWVASVGTRSEHRGGILGMIHARLDALPAVALYAAFGAAAALVPLITSNGYVLRVGFNTLIYMLLALGVNIVVGFAGLLDLGYTAFFGIGAYGYAMFASSQFGLHWPTLAILPIVTVITALFGFLVALPSRRLVGDYLAIVTLFFGQLFITIATNGEKMSLLGFTHPYNVTNGSNGIADIDAFHLFGHELESLSSYYYVALVMFVVVIGAVYLVNESRTGRAWRSLRDDPLAAELMGMPVNRLKLYAFAFGAGIAGLTGTVFASLNTAVFANDFDTPVLITVYAILILGGQGSMGGVILGGLVVNLSLEVLRTPDHATWVFVVVIVATLVAKLRPWRLLGAVAAGTVLLGLAVHAIVGAVWSAGAHGHGAVTGSLGRLLEHWVPIPTDPQTVGNYAFIALVAAVIVLTEAPPLWRKILIAPVLYLSIFVWDARLAFEPSVTRLILIGVILIVLMNARPQGLLGEQRVEIV